MRLAFFIAWRYLFSKKSKNVIHLISIISMVVVAFVTAAMVIVMSAFNGIESLVDDLFAHFDAPVVVEHFSKQPFEISDEQYQRMSADERVLKLKRVLEDDVWISYGEANGVVVMKGVEEDYGSVTGMKDLMRSGNFDVSDTVMVSSVPGLGVCGQLKIPLDEQWRKDLLIRVPIKGRKLSRFREQAFSEVTSEIRGVFSANAELDVKYLFVPLYNAQQMMGMRGKVSSLEVFLKPEVDIDEVAKDWNEMWVNDSLQMTTRNQKNALIYKTTQSEKWATFAILFFILFIASFNIVSSLSMLILEKSNDLKIMSSMGASALLIERVFIFQGVLINALGGLVGLLLGLLICWGQKTFGWIKMEGAVVDHYPIEIDGLSVAQIGGTVLFTGTLFCVFMVRWLMRRRNRGREKDLVGNVAA